MRKVFSRAQVGWLVLALLTGALTGCLVPSRESVKEPGWPATNAEGIRPTVSPSAPKLIKPVIPPETGESVGADDMDSEPPPSPVSPLNAPTSAETPAVVPSQPSGPSAGIDVQRPTRDGLPVPSTEPNDPSLSTSAGVQAAPIEQGRPPTPQTNSGEKVKLVKPELAPGESPAPVEPRTHEWEDQRVKTAAMKLAKESGNVKKGKICYSAKTDEWWVVLYEDAGSAFEVKQFIWDREREKMEPFLVLKRIGKDRLEEDLMTREPGKACEAFDPGR
jgi:hypothetical protein